MERYKGYRVPINCVKSGSLLKKLAAREQTTSDDILHSVTKPDSKDPRAIGPLTSTEDLIEALNLAIGSNRGDSEEHELDQHLSDSTAAEIEDSDEAEVIPSKRRKTKANMEADATYEEPKFVELTKLLPPVPKKGNFEVNTVKKSLYFFS